MAYALHRVLHLVSSTVVTNKEGSAITAESAMSAAEAAPEYPTRPRIVGLKRRSPRGDRAGRLSGKTQAPVLTVQHVSEVKRCVRGHDGRAFRLPGRKA